MYSHALVYSRGGGGAVVVEAQEYTCMYECHGLWRNSYKYNFAKLLTFQVGRGVSVPLTLCR